ncbi:LIC12162 family transferase [Desulfovibrio litoralis]|uniref:Putative transferase, LIC12162 family n=1 Tax=Desulfovibrio litoralis DSM 11393 TaxID=1121455 RepID=A0A1M7TQM5_9BACT|nr:LIC12162 family protein [Desulfovibrio litoralis]SHN73044.1 putative transferase, LIC12162 family [Desulfovibrio litoralis DSM 11393]
MSNKQLCLSVLDYNDKKFQNKERIALGPFCFTKINDLPNLQKAQNTLQNFGLSPWKDSEALLPDISYLRQLSLYLIPFLAKKLNERHQRNESLYFWRWQLSMFLGHFLCSAFEQWKRLELAAKHQDNCDYQGVELENAHLSNTSSFVVASFSSAELHSALATQIIKFMKANHVVSLEKFQQNALISYRTLSEITKNYPMPKALPLRSERGSLKSQLLNLKNTFCQKIFPKNTLIEQNVLGIGLKEALLYPFLPIQKLPPFVIGESSALREFKTGQSPVEFEPADKFEEFIITQVEAFLPNSLWDTQIFQDLMKENSKLLDKYKDKTIFFPAPSIAVDEQTKAFLAYKAEQCANIIMSQHGSHYGTALSYPMLALEEYEQASLFLTWGWDSLENETANFLAFPSVNLAKKAKHSANNDGSILFVTNMRSTYNPRFLSNSAVPELEFDYLFNQLEFFKKIPQNLQGKLIHQEYPYNYSAFQATEIIKKECPWLKTTTQDFFPNYQKAKLLVFDYPGTTLHATLVANIPFILFWNPKVELFSAEAKPLFDALHETGVLFYSPTEAAQALELIYPKLDQWWNEPKRCEAVKKLREKYALTNNQSLILLKSLIKNISDNAKNPHIKVKL